VPLCVSLLVVSPRPFKPTPPPQVSTLSLHDALPISVVRGGGQVPRAQAIVKRRQVLQRRVGRSSGIGALVNATIHGEAVLLRRRDRKSTRLNSSHQIISYAVFCLTKKITESITDFLA